MTYEGIISVVGTVSRLIEIVDQLLDRSPIAAPDKSALKAEIAGIKSQVDLARANEVAVLRRLSERKVERTLREQSPEPTPERPGPQREG